MLIACGLRISEALELVWADVDLERATLLNTASRKAGRGKREVRGSTKGDRFRGVEFGPRIERVVRDLQARESEDGMADTARQPVFASDDRGRLDRRDLSRGRTGRLFATPACASHCACTTSGTPPRRRGWPPDRP